jgi:ribosomal protein L11 methyltransferase
MTFTPEAGFEVLEFGSEAAKKCLEWMESDMGRGKADCYFRLYYGAENPLSLEDLQTQLQSIDPESVILSWKEEEAVDYQAEFRKNFRGSEAGKTYWLGPTWEKPPAGRKPIFIEPGMAFGTGDHPTTQLCVAYIEDLATAGVRPRVIFDLGTGTGVLAIAALQQFSGASIFVSDLDPQCAEDFEKTLRLNSLNSGLFQSFFGPSGDLRRLKDLLPPVDLLISNIYAEVLSGLLPAIDSATAPGAYWIVSGLLENSSSQDFIRRAGQSGFELLESRHQKRQRSLFEKKSGLTLEEETWLGLKFKKRQ